MLFNYTYQPNGGPVSKASPRQLPRAHIIRWCIFLLVESAFVIFAFWCLLHPRRLTISSFSPATVKSGFTTIFILWHSTAALFASAIVSDSFSREWSASRLGFTDRVSVITSGWLDCIIYSFTSRPTGTFKLTFVTSILLFALAHLGPSTITISNDALIDIISLGIGDLTLSRRRTVSIVDLEQVSNVNAGYLTQSNWAIPRPIQIPTTRDTYEYTTDLIHFKHVCEWTTPTIPTSGAHVFLKGVRMGGPLFVEDRPSSTFEDLGSSIYFLRPMDENQRLFGFLLLGGNSTVPSRPLASERVSIDLSDLPTVYSASGFITLTDMGLESAVFPFITDLATAIVCDPQPQLTTGTVRFSGNQLSISSLGSSTPVGNINKTQIPSFFFNALNPVIDSPGIRPAGRYFELVPKVKSINFNSAAAKLLLRDPENGLIRNLGVRARPLDIDTITRNVDAFVLSASKAQADETQDSQLDHVYASVTQVHAKRISGDLALATSKPYLIVLTILFAVTAAILMVLTVLIGKQQRPPFDLEHIVSH